MLFCYVVVFVVVLLLVVLVVIVDVVFVVVVVLNVDVVVQATSKVDLMLHSMEVEFVGGGVVVVNCNNHVKPNSVGLSWGCVEVELGL